MSKILLNNNLEDSDEILNEEKKDIKILPNLFQGRTEAELQNAKFPDWDIIPQAQFINPRIKNQ
ncbi:hypothetical protein [Flavobacterium phragmitis]|uniref:Uncharacterized protein n=1 Tax=Flavobacterium phragmitis TaxID=739143 RepID=A0A1I1PS49_9FLAO|nr:hypothetical protein [Flavobacterium phragmitis]SFD12676.1 hypothetical protein SAMN05216297_104349 [Flavobacterium phragmitis]